MQSLLSSGRRQATRAYAWSLSPTSIAPASILATSSIGSLPLRSQPPFLPPSLPSRRSIHTTPTYHTASPTSDKTTPQSITLYDIFPSTLPDGPPPKGYFPIDVKALRREFLRLQGQAHPDLHPAKDKVRAQGMSALINEAFKTLSNPLLRAQYLLGLRGINPAEDERARVDDPMLLMTVMEVHEAIQEAQKEEDLTVVNEENEGRIAESEGVLEKAFREDNMDLAIEESVRLRYWVNIRDSVQNWEPGKVVSFQHQD